MTKEELVIRLKALKDDNLDFDDRHIESFRLLLKYINDKDIENAFYDLEKWYS
jgi:hypothetical protein